MMYLSIFPVDYTIGKEQLLRRWIVEGSPLQSRRSPPNCHGRVRSSSCRLRPPLVTSISSSTAESPWPIAMELLQAPTAAPRPVAPHRSIYSGEGRAEGGERSHETEVRCGPTMAHVRKGRGGGGRRPVAVCGRTGVRQGGREGERASGRECVKVPCFVVARRNSRHPENKLCNWAFVCIIN
jgi:hypothetical protein